MAVVGAPPTLAEQMEVPTDSLSGEAGARNTLAVTFDSVGGYAEEKEKSYHRHHQHLSIISYYKNTGATKQPLT